MLKLNSLADTTTPTNQLKRRESIRKAPLRGADGNSPEIFTSETDEEVSNKS
jgi:hypothetical protein